MKTIHGAFTDDIPDNYHRLLGPLAFEFTARDLVGRVSAMIGGPIDVLEVACGTGIATRHLAGVLEQGSTLIATDLNAAMINFAREAQADLDPSTVRFEVADALALPYEDASFDLVVCQFGLALFLDRAQGLDEMSRVLRPGGAIALNVWDGFDANPAVGVVNETIKLFFDSDPPGFLDVPFGTLPPEEAQALFARAGLMPPQIDTAAALIRVPDYEAPGRGFVTGNPILLELRERGVDPEEVVEEVLDALEEEFGPPPVELPFQATVYLSEKPG